ncbi:unnamed protein product, partial [Gulo gulo]
MLGTFPECLADQLVLKRWANQLEICALVLGSCLHTSSPSWWAAVRLCSPTFTTVPSVCTSRLCPPRLCISTSETVTSSASGSSLRRTEACGRGVKQRRGSTSPRCLEDSFPKLLLNKWAF